jgi:FkbM family methyltransferase
MKKLTTYLRYLRDYLKHGDIISVLCSVRYILYGKSHSKDRRIKTSIGRFNCRKYTNDFQFANKFYEWGVKKFVLAQHGRYNVFIDGGACIGEYSVLMANYMDRCIAFEPVTSNYKNLVENIGLNHFGNKIKGMQVALGDESREVYFVFNPVNTGASHKSAGNVPSDYLVQQHSFDYLLPQLEILPSDRILFKLDVEGMESEAIRGATEFIKNHNEMLFIIEDKLSGDENIRETLSRIANFEFGFIDDYNIFARKTNNKNT